MSNVNPRARRIARERALQALYSLDITQYAWDEVKEDFWSHNPVRPGARDYADTLVRGVQENLTEIDAEVLGALERWSPERVGHIERALLRMALFEMNHISDVPVNVAINEAIEVAKRFGSEETPRFINGILDRLRRKGSDAPAQQPADEL